MATGKAHYIIARTLANRPSLQHRVDSPHDEYTVCGVFVGNWTRLHQTEPLGIMLCFRCKKIAGTT